MKGINKGTLIAYGVQTVIALVIAYSTATAQGFTPAMEAMWWCRYFSDGFFVAAIVFTGLGLMTWVSSTGFFDIFRYGFSSLLVLFSPLKHPKDHPHYYEYKCEREAKRAGKGWSKSILYVGLACLALSMALVMLYYQLGGV